MKDEKNIEKLIQESLKMEKPSIDFTDKIMNQIEAFETIEEKSMSSLLQKNALESPSINFTSRVMAEIGKVSKPIISKPIISKKVWIFIALVITSIFIYVLGTSTKDVATDSVLDKMLGQIGNLFSFSINLPEILTSPIFALSVFALSSLLFLDYFIRNRNLSLKI